MLNEDINGNSCLKWRRGGNILLSYIKSISKYPILAFHKEQEESIEVGCEKVVAKDLSTTEKPGMTTCLLSA